MYRKSHNTYKVGTIHGFKQPQGVPRIRGDDCPHKSRRIHNMPSDHSARAQGVREREIEREPGVLPLLGWRVGCLGFHGFSTGKFKISEWELKFGREKWGHSRGQLSRSPRAF